MCKFYLETNPNHIVLLVFRNVDQKPTETLRKNKCITFHLLINESLSMHGLNQQMHYQVFFGFFCFIFSLFISFSLMFLKFFKRKVKLLHRLKQNIFAKKLHFRCLTRSWQTSVEVIKYSKKVVFQPAFTYSKLKKKHQIKV